MKLMILATDLANHFKIDKQIEDLCKSKISLDNDISFVGIFVYILF